MLRTFVALTIGLGLAASASAATAPAGSLQMTHGWRVSLDANGKVTALKDSGHLEAAVREPLERAIRSWTFEPGQVDGTPAPTETSLTLDVTFIPTANDNYSVRIDDARTGGVVDVASSKNAMPRFPRDAVRPGLVARVVVKADYDADGRITVVEAQSDQGVNASKSLQNATIAAVRKWKIDPEQVGGHGVASSVMVSVCYTVSAGYPPDFNCAWTPPGSHSKIDNGGSYALAPVSKIKSDVVGHTLPAATAG